MSEHEPHTAGYLLLVRHVDVMLLGVDAQQGREQREENEDNCCPMLHQGKGTPPFHFMPHCGLHGNQVNYLHTHNVLAALHATSLTHFMLASTSKSPGIAPPTSWPATRPKKTEPDDLGGGRVSEGGTESYTIIMSGRRCVA